MNVVSKKRLSIGVLAVIAVTAIVLVGSRLNISRNISSIEVTTTKITIPPVTKGEPVPGIDFAKVTKALEDGSVNAPIPGDRTSK